MAILRQRKKKPNNRFNLINPLSRFVLLASLVYAQTAPSPSGTDLKVKHMLGGRFALSFIKGSSMECYANSIGDCSERLSKEHVISKVLLPEKVGINGLEWCLDEEVFIGKNSFTIKNLCQKHNSDLS